jgi:hypothetical protein
LSSVHALAAGGLGGGIGGELGQIHTQHGTALFGDAIGVIPLPTARVQHEAALGVISLTSAAMASAAGA